MRQHLERPINGIMEPDVFYKILNELKKIPSIQFVVLAAAGEPLMNPYFSEYVAALKKNGFFITCITNMSLANKFMDDLVQCDQLMFSIEGWNKESYEFYRKGLNFEKVKENMEFINKKINLLRQKNSKTPFRLINLLLTRKTDFRMFVDCWSGLTDQIRVDVLLPLNVWNEGKKVFRRVYAENLQDHYFTFVEVKHPIKCTQPFDRISVRANGELVPCCTDFNQGVSYGPFTSLKDFYFNKNLVEIRRGLLNGVLPHVCKLCHLNLQVDRQEVFTQIPALNDYKDNKKFNISF